MLYDPIRNQWVSATAEEVVRQNLIAQMIGQLGYAKGLLAVEKKLSAIASIHADADPERRIDLLCFLPKKEHFAPLLLVECKAMEIDSGAENQLFGYNRHIRAPFLALASPSGVKTLWREKGKIASVPFLPSFSQLAGHWT